MDLPFLKALTAAVRDQATSLKKQANRLHKLSPDIFGQQFTLEQCQEGVARANGYRHWREIVRLAQKTGLDRSLPAWHILSRNNLHERVLSALVTCDVELCQERPTIVLGELPDSAPVATCLWAEQMSLRRVPGIALIDTSMPSLQDTPVWTAAQQLGFTEIFDSFRVIDARAPNIPMVIEATPREWCFAVNAVLTPTERGEFENNGARVLFERFMDASLRARRDGSGSDEILIDASTAYYVANLLTSPEYIGVPSHLDKPASDSLEHDIHKYGPRMNRDLARRVANLLGEVGQTIDSKGLILRHESMYRPVVVLFDQTRPTSVVIAALIHAMFYWRFVSVRAIRPILYVGAENTTAIPNFLDFGSETVIANGVRDGRDPTWDNVCLRHGFFVEASRTTITVSGKRCGFAEQDGSSPETSPLVPGPERGRP